MRRYEGIWRKAYFIPIWIVQCLCAGIFMIIGGLLIAAAGYVKTHNVDSDYTSQGYTADELATVAGVYGGVIFAFAIFTVVFDITECVLYARKTLSPVVLLVFAVLKTLAWGAYFVIAIVSAAKGGSAWGGFILCLVLVLTSIAQLVLGAKYTHRRRNGTLDNRGTYKATAAGGQHVEAGGAYYPPQQQQQPFTTAYGNQHAFNNDSTYKAPSPAPAYGGGGAPQAYPYYGQQGVEMQPQHPAARY